jgi:hypothetical protein
MDFGILGTSVKNVVFGNNLTITVLVSLPYLHVIHQIYKSDKKKSGICHLCHMYLPLNVPFGGIIVEGICHPLMH